MAVRSTVPVTFEPVTDAGPVVDAHAVLTEGYRPYSRHSAAPTVVLTDRGPVGEVVTPGAVLTPGTVGVIVVTRVNSGPDESTTTATTGDVTGGAVT